MLIGVDVDQTILPSCSLWEEWMTKEHNIDMDGGHFTDDFDHEKYLSWWKNENLYEDMVPYKDAVKYLDKLHSEGHKLWIITKCFDEHLESKRKFCDKYFKVDRFFNSGFNKADAFDDVIHYMIDDRPSILSGFKKTKCFRVNTTVEAKTDEFPLMNWNEIYNQIRSADG